MGPYALDRGRILASPVAPIRGGRLGVKINDGYVREAATVFWQGQLIYAAALPLSHGGRQARGWLCEDLDVV